ncbi:MAG: flagellar motor switch protein FliN [Tepidisphaerales bacterium]
MSDASGAGASPGGAGASPGGAGASPGGAGAEGGADALDPSILEAVGKANAEISRSAGAGGVGAGGAAAAGAPAGGGGAGTAGGAEVPVGQSEIDELLKQAALEDPQAASGGGGGAGGGGGGAAPGGAAPFELPSFAGAGGAAALSSIDLLKDVELNVKIELGRSRMLVEDVLKLSEGSVVELDKLAGDPVDVFVNDRLVARGEVLVLNDNFCVRVNEIVAGVRDDML